VDHRKNTLTKTGGVFMDKVLGKIAGVALPYGLFWLMVMTSAETWGAAPSLTVALARLGFGGGMQGGILT
jgi:hypothetical protein